MLRLGFHDCLKYDGVLDEGEINGCDGCLEATGMGVDMLIDFGAEKGNKKGQNVNVTNNNGLTFTVEILEEIYTNPNFPKGTPALDVSMKDSGKSRADLWAFAALLAPQVGIDFNNKACAGNSE